MPIRFFLPLPGPFVLVGRSRAQRHLDRLAREDERERRAQHWAAMSDGQRFRRGLAFAAVVWAVLLTAGWQAGPGWGLLATCAAAINVSAAFRHEARRRRGSDAD